MGDFGLWFGTGLAHIADWQAYDHILFLLALCGMYGTKDWRTLLLLITAFTLGHSLTLLLAVLDIVAIGALWIEFLIPVTIIITCLWNLRQSANKTNAPPLLHYSMALFFGLIHGLGFSFLLKSMLGRETSLLQPLLGFNLGIEAGQLIIIFATLLMGVVMTRVFGITEHKWRFFLSSAIFGIAFLMALERLPI